MKPQAICPCRGGAAPAPHALWRLARWLLPSAALLLMPKCPACFATYFALATGVGISLSVATPLRWSLIVLCAGVLAILVLKTGLRWLRGPRAAVKAETSNLS